jgi:ParB family chromosome partitioning protein
LKHAQSELASESRHHRELVARLQSELEALEGLPAALARLQQQLDEAREQLHATREAARHENQQQMADQHARVGGLQSEVRGLEAERVRLGQTVAQQAASLDELDRDRRTLSAEANQLQQELQGCLQEITRLTQRASEAEQALNQQLAVGTHMEGVAAAAQASFDETERALRSELARLRADAAEARRDLSELEESHGRALTQVQELTQDCTRLEHKLRAAAGTGQELAEVKAKLASAEAKHEQVDTHPHTTRHTTMASPSVSSMCCSNCPSSGDCLFSFHGPPPHLSVLFGAVAITSGASS